MNCIVREIISTKPITTAGLQNVMEISHSLPEGSMEASPGQI
jgi:hypothetical protein